MPGIELAPSETVPVRQSGAELRGRVEAADPSSEIDDETPAEDGAADKGIKEGPQVMNRLRNVK
ncbi:hypothetical protein PVAP13_3KG575000 [Panicum virgatum]|uniref:Uncharacterized protein n=1 Tax=Panicum virgatum TaxID=38727 RepID=A0A8T0V9U7_PANVG|nr:hypothetical protein PVAP13_3KG575000 [Panicum virgatum]